MIILYCDADIGTYNNNLLHYNIVRRDASEEIIYFHNVRYESDTGTYPKIQFCNNKIIVFDYIEC